MDGRVFRIWMAAALILGLLVTASCGKKAIKTEPAVPYAEAPGMADDSMGAGSERDRAMEEERMRREREERLRQEQLRSEASRREMMASRSGIMEENVYFAFDSSALSPAAQEILREKAEWMRRYPSATVIIEGHCDERGTSEYNLALGDRRAQSVKSFMVNLGISPGRMTTISYGEERPVAPGHNEFAWAKNRRANFVVE